MNNIYTSCDINSSGLFAWKISLVLIDVMEILMQGYEILQNRDIKSGKSSNFVIHEIRSSMLVHKQILCKMTFVGFIHYSSVISRQLFQ